MRSGGGVSFKVTGRRRAAAVVACWCMLLLTGYAQTGVQEKKPGDAALELKLSAYEASVCLDSALTLSLEITNTGQQQLKLLKADLWRAFAYSQVADTRGVGEVGGGAEVGCGGGDVPQGGWIVLEPGDKYSDTFAYRLNAASFFKKAGRYKISTSLPYYVAEKQAETVVSNHAEFEIQDCAAK